MKHRTRAAAAGLAAAALIPLALTGCTADETDDSKGTLTFGFLPSWPDGLSMAHLLEEYGDQFDWVVE